MDARNVFPGLLWDGDRKLDYAGVRDYEYLSTRPNPNDERPVHRMSYGRFEHDFVGFLTAEDFTKILESGKSAERREAEKKLEATLAGIDKISRRTAELDKAFEADDVDAATLKVLAARTAKEQASMETLAVEKNLLQAKLVALQAKDGALSTNPQQIRALVQEGTPKANEIRLRLRSLIRDMVSRIELTFKRNGAPGAAVATYVNGKRGYILFC